MAADKELEAGLKRMAEDVRLIGGGRMKLLRLIGKHLRWFDIAEHRGMGWRDMIRALTAAGVVSRTGQQLSVGTVSSTVWREREKRERENLAADRGARQPQLPSTPPARKVNLREAKPTAGEHQGGSKNSTIKDVFALMDRARAVRQRSE